MQRLNAASVTAKDFGSGGELISIVVAMQLSRLWVAGHVVNLQGRGAEGQAAAIED